MIIEPRSTLNGTISVPGDKSISHRSIMLGALAQGRTLIEGFLMGEDCLSTIRCFKQLGIEITVGKDGDRVEVLGKGLHGLEQPTSTLDVGNSGTTLRLLTGILASQPFSCTITGDASIRKRPMNRVVDPLRLMGAKISGKENGKYCPLMISEGRLQGITYKMLIASAQVKSCLLLAGLYAQGKTTLVEPAPSRNHTELMLSSFGIPVENKNGTLSIEGGKKNQLIGQHIFIPGDISSASYFMTAGMIVPKSSITIKNVGINPTRDGIIKALKRMNGNIQLSNIHTVNGEKIGDIHVSSSELRGTKIEGSIIPTLIDEIPILAVAACYAKGTTIIKDAQELKVKESNRIDTMVSELSKMGAKIHGTEDGLIIEGGIPLKGAVTESHDDHRVAMSLAVAALGAAGTSEIENSHCIQISFPDFESILKSI